MKFHIGATVFVFGILFFIFKRSLRYLRYLQQEDYDADRFFHWIWVNRAFDIRGSLICVLSLIPVVGYSDIILCMQGLLFLSLGFFEQDPRIFGKKKLVLTKRAKGILLVAISISVLVVLSGIDLGVNGSFLMQVYLTQSPPLFLAMAVLFLSPKEKRLQIKYLKEAHDKFVSLNPFTIGVTGSYGKTSVKNLLGEMMSLCLGPTFWPPEGINTPMGITRLIREKLNSSHKYAVIEMGAYKEGSIKRLCDLTPVNAGIVTAVHLMHLERMGSEEQIYKAKSELPQAVPNNGIIVVNGDNAGARKMATEFRKETTLVYGLDKSKGELDVYLDEIKFDRGGTNFSISYNGVSYRGFTRMHGRGALSNICACFSLLASLGVNPELIIASLRDIKSVNNRLEVVDYKSFIQINDAYNSNPIGFRYALEVLKDLPGKRKVIITPGMIELGEKVYEENKAVGIEAGKVSDFIILVNETNKKAFFDGLEEIKYPKEQIKWFLTRDEALNFYKEIQAEGDVLLLENDLPDLQEFKEIF